MATIYLRSTDGSDSDNGSTWALAKATIDSAITAAGASGTVYVSQSHAQAISGSWSANNGAGGNTQAINFICGNDAAQPPTSLATTATITSTGNIVFQTPDYWYGISFSTIGANAGSIGSVDNATNKRQVWEQCSFILGTSNSGSRLNFNQSGGGSTIWRGCNVKFTHASQGMAISGHFHWQGGSVISGGTSPTALITSTTPGSNQGSRILIESLDLSNLSTSVNLVTAPNSLTVQVVIRDCALPASWSGTLKTGTINSPGSRISMYNCDSSGTNYRLWIEDYAGTIRDETTIVRTGGASDGTTTLAWKMTSNTNISFPLMVFASDEFVLWNDDTGSSKTVSVEIMHDSATALNDDEVWLEVSYLGSSSAPNGSLANDRRGLLSSAAAQTTSAETWTTTGLTNPNAQTLSVSFTPQQKGYFIARVMLAKASKTIYVDPKLNVS